MALFTITCSLIKRVVAHHAAGCQWRQEGSAAHLPRHPLPSTIALPRQSNAQRIARYIYPPSRYLWGKLALRKRKKRGT
jgi:hypothetical protein